ncbi:HIT-like protein [Auriculariales sp. MPI-PUGE-AT-0066]|nr:HIT-like protein [Auriculariales sp. MPI-PUGE-AT-0066]
MTSHIISAHTARADIATEAWKPYPSDPENCVFCRIVRNEQHEHHIYDDPDGRVSAFLDILPIRPGHTLVIPRTHVKRLTDLDEEDAAALGKAVSRVGRAITEALGNTGLNIVCNQEYAQAVPHVHFHIVPAPILDAPMKPPVNAASPESPTTLGVVQQLAHVSVDSRSGNSASAPANPLQSDTLDHKTMLRLERDAREELDDFDGAEIARRIRSRL